ncbi:MAG TPA: L,D-transpeptidase family protein [Firmicutes bacterium]|jgi:lipoprotein-anchoring transpeptidase ErfK/SrfK|nr:L,D-transpeptidase family protein [Bacillota bacterium]
MRPQRLWGLLIAILLLLPGVSRSQPFTCGISLAPLMPGPDADPVDVADLQTLLQNNRYYFGPIDGIYDEALAAAVRAFKQAQHLEPTAVIDEDTWSALAKEEPSTSDATTKPKPTGRMRVEVDTVRLRLTLFVNDEPYKSYPVAVGKMTGYNWSPVGDWRIVSKGVNWGGGFGTRWLGLNVPWGTYGIHGTNKPYSIGTRASHGCIRMHNRDVEELYSWVPVGTPVRIIGQAPAVKLRSQLRMGDSGQDVVKVQQHMQALGLQIDADGRYGPKTRDQVRYLQELYGLPADGAIYNDMYYLLGLK